MAKSTLSGRLKKLVKQLKDVELPEQVPPEHVPMRVVVEAVLLDAGTARDVEGTVELFEREFVDYNELRVIEPRILADMLTEDHPSLIDQIEPMLLVLNQVISDRHQMNLDHLVGLSKDNAQKGLEVYDTLSETSRAYIMLFGLGHNVVAITAPAARSLVELGLFDRGTSAHDMQKKIDRVLPRGDVYRLCLGLTRFGDKLTPSGSKKKTDASADKDTSGDSGAVKAKKTSAGKATRKTSTSKKTSSAGASGSRGKTSSKKTTDSKKTTARKATKKKTTKKSAKKKTAKNKSSRKRSSGKSKDKGKS